MAKKPLYKEATTDLVESKTLNDYKFILKDVLVNQIRYAPFNPPDRLDESKEAFKRMQKSIREIGVQDRVDLVTTDRKDDYIVAEGNTRVRICEIEGIAKIPAKIYLAGNEWLHCASLLYELNVMRRPLTDKQAFHSYLLGGKPLFKTHITDLKTYIKIYGSKQAVLSYFKKFPEAIHPNILRVARSVVKYCYTDLTRKSDGYYSKLKEILHWMVTTRNQSLTSTYIKLIRNGNKDPRKLRNAINNGHLNVPGFEPRIAIKEDGTVVDLEQMKELKSNGG